MSDAPEAPQPAPTVEALRAEVEALRLENQGLRRRLEGADDAAREDFFALAAHELRSPLFALRMALDLVISRVAGSADAVPTDWLLSRLVRAQALTRDLSRVVDTVVDVGQVRAGRLQLRPEPVDLGELVEDVASRLDADLAHAGCELLLSRQGPLTGAWDRARLGVVVGNLLSNAIKFGPGAPIEVRLEGRGEAVELRVSDRGPGVAAADRERLFGRYERLGAAGRTSGLGLGLWICRELVVAQGGTIGLESEPGRGATFRVTLPRAPPPAGR